jgi:hypothetical protein
LSLALVVVDVGVDFAGSGNVLLGCGALLPRSLGMFLGGELGLLRASLARLRLLAQLGRFLAAAIEPPLPAEGDDREADQDDRCYDDHDDPDGAHADPVPGTAVRQTGRARVDDVLQARPW